MLCYTFGKEKDMFRRLAVAGFHEKIVVLALSDSELFFDVFCNQHALLASCLSMICPFC